MANEVRGLKPADGHRPRSLEEIEVEMRGPSSPIDSLLLRTINARPMRTLQGGTEVSPGAELEARSRTLAELDRRYGPGWVRRLRALDERTRDALLGAHSPSSTLDPRRRAMLREKGRLLFNKTCDGVGTCAENFALHHLRIGDLEVVRDFVDYLRLQLEGLSPTDPRHAVTEALIERISAHLPASAS